MSRSIPYIDGGELTTVLWTLGVAHPTGYPLFTLLGYLFVHIPLVSEVAVRANLFALFCTAAASGIFYFVFLNALHLLSAKPTTQHGGTREKKAKKIKQKKANEPIDRLPRDLEMKLAASLATLSLIFSRTFWEQGTSVEVYPLQLLLFATIILVWLHFYETPTKPLSFFSGLVLGLGFTNHMTTILAVPALIFLFITSYKRKNFDLKQIYLMILGGASSGLLYIYLPIRAAESPILDWGNPDNLQRFVWLVTGKQFRTWMFSSFDVFQQQLGVFFSSLYPEFRITILIVIAGAVVSFFGSKTLGSFRKYFWFSAILFISDLVYAANYSIHDISSYFLLAYISLCFLAAIGFRWAIDMFFRRTKAVVPVSALLAIFPLVSAFTNYNDVNESGDFSVEQYAKDILSDLPKNSLVLSFQWDNFVSASLYYQYVDNMRPDVIVVDKELLRRSWYTAQIHKKYSFLFPARDAAYDAYQANLRLFENDLQYNANSIEMSYSNFIREIISGANHHGRDVFVGPEIEDQYLRGYTKVPRGLLFELTTDTAYLPFNVSGLNGFQAAKAVNTDYSRQIMGFYERMFMARGEYEYNHKKLNQAIQCLDKALEVDPTSQTAESARQRVSQELNRK